MNHDAAAGPRVAVVSGGGRSNGRAIALALGRGGTAVAVLDAPQAYGSLVYPVSGMDETQSVVDELTAAGGRAIAVQADVRDPENVRAALHEVETTLGPITDLAVCSGVVSAAPLARMSRAEWDEVLATNLTGAFHLVQAVVPGLVERRRGHVVFVTGPEARRGFARLSHVSAAAWALVGLAKTLALEVAGAGVTVNVICAAPPPSVPLTALAELQAAAGASAPMAGNPPWEQLSAAYPQGRPYVSSEEVAAAVEFLVSDAARSWTGAVVDLSLGAAARNSA